MGVESSSPKKIRYIITKAPHEWLDASLQKHNMLLDKVKNRAGDQVAALQQEQASRWTEKTHVKPEDSHFTVIVPIHNEEPFLPSLLGSLLTADIPAAVHANILFVTNACTDKSSSIIDDFISFIGNTNTSQQEKSSGSDRKIPPEARMGNSTFSHIDTAVAGKANALNIGNKHALKSNHIIAMSIDANNFVEPDFFRHMFAKAHEEFADLRNNTVIVSGMSKHVTKGTRLRSLFDQGRKLHNAMQNEGTFVNGWCMAWDTQWLQSIGGMPQVAAEDYALGIYARKYGKQAVRVTDAVSWGYNPNSLSDLVEQRARKARGVYQMLEADPSLLPIIRDDLYVFQEPKEKVKTLKKRMITHPLKSPFYAVDSAIWEYAKHKGKSEYDKDPFNQSWKAIGSTKR